MAVESGGASANTGMHEIDRIAQALTTKHLDAHLFERCATDLLIEVYPGLSGIPGGTDWGRDADIHGVGDDVPPRLMVTSSRSIKGVQANLVSGLESLTRHKVPVRRVVLANPAVLNEQQRKKLKDKAQDWKVTIEAIYDREFFVSKLRRDGEWRKALLGLSGEPITLSRAPSDLAESPWASIPLVGRDLELEQIKASNQDIILTGPPGVGKTRLVAAVNEAVFVDADLAESGRLADDLRWINPTLLVLDDAGQQIELIRKLIKLRRAEGDLLKFRLICICWPDEVDAVSDAAPSATTLELQLLERQGVDSVITSMGVRSQLARQQILDQAEGRPGWAIALADMLTKTSRWDSLYDGKVLLGEVERYLRRASLGANAIDLLTIVSAMGTTTDRDIAKQAVTLNLSVPATRGLLHSSARSGLLDTTFTYDSGGHSVRRYAVRPPMLAVALVAEHAFRSDVPAVHLLDLADKWPANLFEITESAIHSCLLGASEARSVAAELIDHYRNSDVGTGAGLRSLALAYAQVDLASGREMLSWAREDFDGLASEPNLAPSRFGHMVEVAALVAGRHLLPEAVGLILDVALLDPRPTNQHPNHPLRKIEQLITNHHPDLNPTKGIRELIADTTERWISRRQVAPGAWDVYGAVAASCLSLHRSGRYLDAVNRNTLHMTESVVTAAEAKEIYEKIWPAIKARLGTATPLAIRDVVDAVVDWLRVGGGHDRPFGAEHAAASMKVAKRLGTKMLRELTSTATGQPGVAAYLIHQAAWFNIGLKLKMPKDLAVFFTDIDRRNDLQAAVDQTRAGIKVLVLPWAKEDPVVAVRRLCDLRSQLEVGRVNWPNRIGWACEDVAGAIKDPAPWVEAALDEGLFPEAEPFLGPLVMDEGHDGLIQRCLDVPNARWRAIDAVLSAEASPYTSLVLGSLDPRDMPVLESLSFMRRLSVERQRDLLTTTSPAVRGAAAFAMARPVHEDDEDWPPSELESEWLAAIQLLDPSSMSRVEDYQLRSLFRFLAKRYPATLTAYVETRLQAAAVKETLSFDEELIVGLHLLPDNAKISFLAKFGDTPVRYLLLRYMPGENIGWVGDAIDAGLMTPDEALNSRTGFGLGPEPSIVDLAELLVPRGVPPEAIAAHIQFGMGWGEESDRANAFLKQCEDYAASGSAHIAAVGQAGVEMYTRKRDVALQRERTARVRGQL